MCIEDVFYELIYGLLSCLCGQLLDRDLYRTKSLWPRCLKVSREAAVFETLHAATLTLTLHRDEARLSDLTNLIILYVHSDIMFMDIYQNGLDC